MECLAVGIATSAYHGTRTAAPRERARARAKIEALSEGDIPFHSQRPNNGLGAGGRQRRFERGVSLDDHVQVVVVRKGVRRIPSSSARACAGTTARSSTASG